MKKVMYLFLTLIFLLSFDGFAGTCSSISYTSSAANSTLTSTKYNTDNSTVYNFVNAYDAGCITSQTLEADALDQTVATGFAVPLNGIVDGCKVTKAHATELSIGNCIASVNNNWIKTASATSVTWAHLDTGAEAASTYYYVYIDSTSDGTTLTPVLSVTAPGTDGMNGSDRVLARVWNDVNSDFIATVSQWKGNRFEKDRIFAQYDTDSGQGIANTSVDIINFDATEFGFDSHNAVTTGTWKFTAPLAGKYSVISQIVWAADADWSAGETAFLYIYKEGALVRTNKYEVEVTRSATPVNRISSIIDMEAGEYIDVRAYQDSGGTVALWTIDESNYISIEYLGDE